jgi:hypothetical protein
MRYKVNYFSIPDYANLRKEMREWCEVNVGEFLIHWRFRNGNWCFRYKKDYVFFLLRWK